MSEENAYILGTDEEELIRLELQHKVWLSEAKHGWYLACLLYTSPSPRDGLLSRMPSSA